MLKDQGRLARATCNSSRRAFRPAQSWRAKQHCDRRHRCIAAVPQSVAAAAVVGPSVEALEKLASWCKSKGASVDKLAVSRSLTTGQGILTAAKDISAGEAVFTLGEGLWLSPEAVRNSSIGKAVEGLEPWLQVALYLVLVRHKPEAGSEWAAYLGTVPGQPATPLFWTDAQQSMLQGTQVMDSMQGYRAFFEFKYQELFGSQGVLAGQTGVFPPVVYTYDNFLAAVATVRCRAHAPLDGEQLSLVPLADAVAHRRQANTCWKLKPAGLFGKGQQLVVEATRAIRKGEELSMDYAAGKLDNATLLDYGVLDTNTPQPGYSLTISIDESDRLRDDKLDVVENTSGLAASMTFNLAPASEPEVTMMGLLRLINLKGADVFLLEPVFSQQVWDFMCEPVSQDNEKAVCTSMIEGAKAALSRYAGSIDADLAALRSGSIAPGSPEDLAIRVRLGEREALDGLQQWFEQRVMGLKRLEYYQERRLRRLGLIDDDGRTTYDSFFKDSIA